MALLVVDLGERPEAVRVDLAVLTGDRGVAAVDGVTAGAHHVSLLLTGGWQHGWLYVEPDDEIVTVGPAGGTPSDVAPDAIVAMPPDGGGWAALTTHLDSRESLTGQSDGDDAIGSTRFERVLASHGGDAQRVLAALERSFVEWTLLPDGRDPAALERWRTIVVAVAACGPSGIEGAPGLVVEATIVLAAQLSALPAGSVDESLLEALGDLADDLTEVGEPDLVAAAATLRAALDR